jgi:hypothetical protein
VRSRDRRCSTGGFPIHSDRTRVGTARSLAPLSDNRPHAPIALRMIRRFLSWRAARAARAALKTQRNSGVGTSIERKS